MQNESACLLMSMRVISALAAFQSLLYSYPPQAISMPCSLTSLPQPPLGCGRLTCGRYCLSDGAGKRTCWTTTNRFLQFCCESCRCVFAHSLNVFGYMCIFILCGPCVEILTPPCSTQVPETLLICVLCI